MKTLVITGSRADRNGLEVVHEALLKARHESKLLALPSNFVSNMPECAVAIDFWPDVAIVGGDRLEILLVALWLAREGHPIAHIAGGDVTEGSADDRYRDAITALSCIHFATNDRAYKRLLQRPLNSNAIYLTGSPAIDRIKQTPVLDKTFTLNHFSLQPDMPTVLVCVHPNTVGDNPMADAEAVHMALVSGFLGKDMQFICLGANADPGGARIDHLWRNIELRNFRFVDNVSPQLYYSLMTHCDVMVGNSSAMLYEAPCFNLPCVLYGDRQKGRVIPGNVLQISGNASIEGAITAALQTPPMPFECFNPYGDGHSAPRIVKALEENAWRWTSKSMLKPTEAQLLSSA